MGQEAMLLAGFSKQLSLAREFNILDPGNLGRKMADSFIVEIRVKLATADPAQVELSAVGTLLRDKEAVLFKPAEELKADVTKKELKLAGFFKKQEVYCPPYLILEQSRGQYPGLDLLSRIGSDFLQSLMSQDPRLKKIPTVISIGTLVEGMCLGVHDAICCGAGIELETIGVFYPDLKFDPDPILRDTIENMMVSARDKNVQVADFKVSQFKVGPLPKMS